MKTRRLFIAIKIANTDEIYRLFQLLQIDLKNESIKWVDLNGLHITLYFIGATNVALIPVLMDRLGKIGERISSFVIRLKSVGAFSSVNRARVIWTGVEADSNLFELQKEIENELSFIVPQNRSQFFPHLTIGRIKQGVKKPEMVSESLCKYKSWEDQKLQIEEFALMESLLTKQGPIYKVLKQFKLSENETDFG